MYFAREPKQRGRVRYTGSAKCSANNTTVFVRAAWPQGCLTESLFYPPGNGFPRKGKAPESWGIMPVAIQMHTLDLLVCQGPLVGFITATPHYTNIQSQT